MRKGRREMIEKGNRERIELVVRQIRAEKSESCAILHRSMKLCMVVEGDWKINFRSGATAKFFYFWP